jgi:hypothetical protein
MAWCRPYGPQSPHEVETVTAQTRSPCANVGVHPGPRRRAVRAGKAFRSALILALYRGVCRNLRGRSYRRRLDVGARAFATRWAAFSGRPDFCAVGHSSALGARRIGPRAAPPVGRRSDRSAAWSTAPRRHESQPRDVGGARESFCFFGRAHPEQTGHHVITTGPYGFVRHPGCLAALVLFPTSGMALGSWLASHGQCFLSRCSLGEPQTRTGFSSPSFQAMTSMRNGCRIGYCPACGNAAHAH